MPQEPVRGEARTGLLRRVIEWWALAGGVILLAIALMTTWSAFSGWVFGKPLAGDFELTEIFVAVAVFAFLPYCQLTDANVTADLFTARAGPRTLAGFGLLAGLLALGIAVLLSWRTWAGLIDYRKYVETTTILKIPIWTAYVPALASLALLVLACLVSLRESWRALRRG
ncbi:MAG: C4-dicarboxylate ABC transporter [Betaproteobacteria bacterium SG8_39]|nr:MAG: C4-dicarboxylate ABC transporter [Betaproteobacteria bacterium SG8_39]